MPRCLGASGSVRTKQRQKSASCAPDVHTFWPLTTKQPSRRSAFVVSDARSLPALGSLMPRHHVISPLSVGTTKRSFCSSVPNSTMEAAQMESPCGLSDRGTCRSEMTSK